METADGATRPGLPMSSHPFDGVLNVMHAMHDMGEAVRFAMTVKAPHPARYIDRYVYAMNMGKEKLCRCPGVRMKRMRRRNTYLEGADAAEDEEDKRLTRWGLARVATNKSLARWRALWNRRLHQPAKTARKPTPARFLDQNKLLQLPG